MSLVLQSSGGGSVTLEEPVTASNFTITVPATTGTMALTSNIPASYTNADVLTLFSASGSAPVYACRAWVNFNGTGTVAIRASGNVSSITDNGTGDYTVNFTTAMPDANYSSIGNSGTTTSDYRIVTPNFNAAPTASSCRIRTSGVSSNATDDLYTSFAIFR